MANHADTISSEEPLGPGRPGGGETRATGVGVRATAMSAALTLVVATGVATAAYRGTSGDSAPTALIPATAFAVASADLSLPGGQSGSLEALLGHFPGLHLAGDGSIRDRVIRTLLHDADGDIDYDTDVQPWLGDHVAVAGWADAGKPALEVVLQSTDDPSARQHLSDLAAGTGHFVVRDGYAVIGSSQAAVDDALAAAAKSSLDDTASYDDDIAALPDNEAITGWFDGPAAGHVFGGMLQGGAAGVLAFSGLGMLGGPGAGGGLFKGRVAIGVHVTDTVAQLDVRDFGGVATSTAPTTMLTSLPSGTIAAVEFGDPGQLVDRAMPLIRLFGSFGATSVTCSATPPTVPLPSAGAIPRRVLLRQLRTSIEPGTPHRRAIIRKLLRARHRAIVARERANKGVPPLGSSGCTTSAVPPTDPLAAISDAIGVQLPDDAKTLLGDRAVISFGGLELAGLPDVAIRSHPSDLAAAQPVAESLRSHLSGHTGFDIDVSTAGDDLVLATSSAYGSEIAKTGALGDAAQAKTALDAMPDQVSIAAYVDLSRIWPLLGSGVPDDVTHLHAVGLWAGQSGDVQSAQLRLVVG